MPFDFIVEPELAIMLLNVILCVYLRFVYVGSDRANPEFWRLCVTTAVCCMADAACGIVLSARFLCPAWVKVLFAVLIQCIMVYTIYRLLVYTCAAGKETKKQKRLLYALKFFPGVYVYLQIVCFFTGLNVYAGASGMLEKGALDVPMRYGYALVMLLTGMWMAFTGGSAYTRGQLRAMRIIYLSTFVFLLLHQLFVPQILLVFLWLSMATYTCFFLLETPAYGELESTLRMLTEAKGQAEEALNEAKKADEEKSEFLANMSHEIRTPLTTVLGMDDVILSRHESGAIHDYAKDIRSAGTTLLNIINDVLDFSKIESGELELALRAYHLGQVLHDVENMIRIRASAKDLEFIMDTEDTLPDELFGDPLRVHQIIVNLAGNAVKYTRRGQVRITVTGEHTGDQSNVNLHITVTDTGIGIREEDLPKLFESFSRVDAETNRGVEGTGLGLAITGRLIDLMGGVIDVDSTYGKGSTFHCVLPQRILGTGTIGEYLQQEHENAVQHTGFSAPEARVLIVDDNDMNRLVLKALLKDTGMQIDEAPSGEDCLKMVRESAYDLIFMDYMMPGMDGVETLRHFKEMKTNASVAAKVVICTANAVVGFRAEMLAAGFDDFLSKPIEQETMNRMLKELIPQDKQGRAREVNP